MKNQTLLVTFLTAVTFTVGCNQEKTTPEKLDDLKTETQSALADLKDFTFAQKNAFLQTLTTQVNVLEEEFAKLAAKIDSSSDALKAQTKPKFEALRAQMAQLKQQLVVATQATPATWDTVKTTAQKTYASVTNGFTEARQWVSEQVAP